MLGAILVNPTLFSKSRETLKASDFSIQKHRLIWDAMLDLANSGMEIDRVTVANKLQEKKALKASGGLSYLADLDASIPAVPSVDSYISIVKEKSALRHIIYTSQQTISDCLEEKLDAASILNSAATKLSNLSALANPGYAILSAGEYFDKHGLDKVLSPKRSGITTGFKSLDDIIYGFEPGKVYIVAGDSTWGKTALALNMLTSVCEGRTAALLFTLEMSYDEILQRIACSVSGVPHYKIKHHICDPIDRMALIKATDHIGDLPLFVDDTSSIDLNQFASRSMRMIRGKSVKVIALDYIQIMSWMDASGRVRFRDEVEALNYISRAMKMYAKEWNVSILLVSQLSRLRSRRVTKDLRPKLSDLHGSSALEKNADVVMFIYRPEMDQPDKVELRGKAELIVRKNRGGPQGTINMTFNGKIYKFIEEEPMNA